MGLKRVFGAHILKMVDLGLENSGSGAVGYALSCYGISHVEEST